MATEVVHAIEISLVDISTKSVTLGPQMATIVREISGVLIKPGANEITIYGVDPQVDPDSIRVSGKGPGTITDIQTTTVTQRNSFEELFPGCEVEPEDNHVDHDDPDDDFGVDRSELSKKEKELKLLDSSLAAAHRELETARKSIEFLDDYGKSMKAGDTPVARLEEYLRTYQTQRLKLGDYCYECEGNISDISNRKSRLCRKMRDLEAAFSHARDAAAKPEHENRKRKQHEHNITVAEKKRRREAQTNRRNSTISVFGASETAGKVELSITYVTKKAGWVPCYELNLTTLTSSGKAVYLAEYHNFSSEVWRDAKENTPGSSSSDGWRNPLENHVGFNARVGLENCAFNRNNIPKFPTTNPSLAPATYSTGQLLGKQQQQQRQLTNIAQAQRMLPPPPHTAIVLSPSPPPPAAIPASSGNLPETTAEDDDATICADLTDAVTTLSDTSNALTFQESSRQDYGLTTNYDIPGQRTLRPSPLKCRHVIAEIDFPRVEFSHVINPKLRPAAFLRAKAFNTSSLALLRGNVGLTLDGTFMGVAVLPGSRPNTTFSLSLGVDPGIQVNYATPVVHRTSGGCFTGSSESTVFTRSCWIGNTKSTAVSLVVLDQVPVSETEGLQVNILQPKGLSKEGDSVSVVPDSSAAKAIWGSGRVTMLKSGEIMWQLALEKGKEAKLTLDFETKMPSGQKMTGAY
ncbi:hypothetical protein PABG_01313 [Paracoccidioides brasiliensis Pb03]|nr:hypothetical protein PABG_01313 [Paracoccidioides brasiliensis Pb03]